MSSFNLGEADSGCQRSEWEPPLQDVIRQICIKISERAPEFGIGNLVAELLQDPSNWDTLLIGLRSLIAILLSAPARLVTSQKDVEIEVG